MHSMSLFQADFPGDVFLMVFKAMWPLFAAVFASGIVFRILEDALQEKAAQYFLRRYRVEFFTLLFAIVGYGVSYAFIARPGLAFLLSVGVTLVATMVIVYAKTSERDFYFISLRDTGDKEDWIGEGTFHYERVHGTYAITDSHSGFIFSKSLTWSDYVYDFEFKILRTSLGVILRATNLSNLIMLQILENGISSHIRINGFWQVWKPEETGMIFASSLNLDSWYRARFQCDKGSIRIRLYDSSKVLLFDRVWRIPTGTISVSYKPEQDIGLAARSLISSIPFPINLEYGTAGFRNDGEEKALVKDVLIEKIQGGGRLE